jgi:hypothetical protein
LTQVKTENREKTVMKFKIFCHSRAIGILILILCLAAPVVLPEASQAQGRYFKEEWLGSFPAYYPRGFDGYGRIDRINLEEVVIDDDFFKLAIDIRYSTPLRKHATSIPFEPGRLVGYILNQRREIESLWFIE